MRRFATIASAVLLVAMACAPSAGALAVKKSKRIKGPLATASVDAGCPKGTRATGGGFRQTQQNVITLGVVFESRKIGQRTWRVSVQLADHGAATGKIKVTAVAYCRAGAPRTAERSKSMTIPGANLIGSATAACPPGKEAVAGGFQTPFLSGGFKQSPITFDPLKLTLAYPFASLGSGERWKAAAVQAGGTAVAATTTLKAIAYCG